LKKMIEFALYCMAFGDTGLQSSITRLPTKG
jgi:hypothetical protein